MEILMAGNFLCSLHARSNCACGLNTVIGYPRWYDMPIEHWQQQVHIAVSKIHQDDLEDILATEFYGPIP